jgi:hypothetical protein
VSSAVAAKATPGSPSGRSRGDIVEEIKSLQINKVRKTKKTMYKEFFFLVCIYH